MGNGSMGNRPMINGPKGHIMLIKWCSFALIFSATPALKFCRPLCSFMFVVVSSAKPIIANMSDQAPCNYGWSRGRHVPGNESLNDVPDDAELNRIGGYQTSGPRLVTTHGSELFLGIDL